MADPTPQANLDRPNRSQLCDEIGRAVGSLWQRRSGVRPASVSTEYVGDVVRCTIQEGEPEAETSEDPEATADPATLGLRAYEHQAQAAVRRVTGRTVTAVVVKPAKSASEVTNAFILERVRVKY